MNTIDLSRLDTDQQTKMTLPAGATRMTGSVAIDAALVSRVASLARLAPDAAEQAMLQQELSQILGHFQRLTELDTTDVPPAYHPQQLENWLRPDEVRPSANRDDLLALTARQKDGCLMVPRTVE